MCSSDLQTYEKSYEGEQRKSTRKPKKTISHNQVFGTPEQLSDLQDWGARVMQAAGHKLARGERKTSKGPDHTTPAEGRKRIQQAEEQAQAILRGAERAAEATLAAAEGEAAKIIEKATPERFLEMHRANKALEKENGELRQENASLRDFLTDWIARYNLLREQVFRFVAPEPLAKLQEAFKAHWSAYPKTPSTLNAEKEAPVSSNTMEMR